MKDIEDLEEHSFCLGCRLFFNADKEKDTCDVADCQAKRIRVWVLKDE